MTHWVYILECADGKLYTGVTTDVAKRVAEHEQGIFPDAFTFSRRPVTFLRAFDFANLEDARTFERQVKGWSRKKKWALIDGGIEAVFGLQNRAQASRPSTGSGRKEL